MIKVVNKDVIKKITKQEIENNLRTHLLRHLPHHNISQIYEYATLPAGKAFRPNLVWSILFDLNSDLYQASLQNPYSPHALMASAVEFHHSYTLIHDDLPCMDNDSERRGKPSTHIAFGEWQALLAGDGLLNLSYQLISKINHPRTLEVFKFFSWALGPKGLIHGQVLDLSQEMNLNLENTLLTHELKTARLIQVAIFCSALLSEGKNFSREKNLWRYSKLLGINFQLIDDLSELTSECLSDHEKSVNPWLRYPERTNQSILNSLHQFHLLSQDLKLESTNSIVIHYYQTMLMQIETHLENIQKHLPLTIDLTPMILLMKSLSEKKNLA
jgi:geranylgeranyl pyrophosphate synthase